MAEKKFDLAVELRGRSFQRNLETYKMLTRLKPPKDAFDAHGKGKEGYTLAVMHIGGDYYYENVKVTELTFFFQFSTRLWYECCCPIVCAKFDLPW